MFLIFWSILLLKFVIILECHRNQLLTLYAFGKPKKNAVQISRRYLSSGNDGSGSKKPSPGDKTSSKAKVSLDKLTVGNIYGKRKWLNLNHYSSVRGTYASINVMPKGDNHRNLICPCPLPRARCIMVPPLSWEATWIYMCFY